MGGSPSKEILITTVIVVDVVVGNAQLMPKISNTKMALNIPTWVRTLTQAQLTTQDQTSILAQITIRDQTSTRARTSALDQLTTKPQILTQITMAAKTPTHPRVISDIHKGK